MQDHVKQYPPKTDESQTLPKQRMFMLGNGLPVLPSVAEGFCDKTVNESIDFRNENRAWFQIGFAAAVDMIARGTMDFSSSPELITQQAWQDVNNITIAPNKVTDVMRMVV